MSVVCLPSSIPAVSSATVVRWLKSPGDEVVSGDALVELETESGLLVVEAAESGKVLGYRVKPGQTLLAGAELAEMAEVANVRQSAGMTKQPEKSVAEPKQTTGNTAGDGAKATPILMPQAGNTMEEGTVISWRVKEGDTIAVGQILCEIETDKATMDFESPDAGRLARIVAKVGEPVAVKQPIAVLAASDADADAFLAGGIGGVGQTIEAKPQAVSAPVKGNNQVSSQRVASPAVLGNGGRVKASPAARKVAAERGIELASVGVGSGPGGRILSSDLAGLTATAAGNGAAAAGEIRRPLSKMRRAIGLNLQQSKQTVPHFYVRTSIDADPLMAFYREQKVATGCTLNDIIVLAVGRAMMEFPAVRSQIVGNELVEYPHANIGIAVGIDDGLVVPVVTNVDTLSLGSLAAETKRIVEQARKGRLENIGKGHFTISNLGMFGVEEFSAIINPPESGILAVSAAREAVIVENGAMRAGRSMTMTLSADHRLVDGVMAAKFMQRLKDLLEHPLGEKGKLA